MRIRTRPNVHTIVAPVGRSTLRERYTPSADTSVPIDQPIARRFPIESAYSIAATDGTIKYRQPVRVDAQCDRGVLVTELPAHVRNGRPVLQEQTRRRVSHLVAAAPIELGRIEYAIERLPHVSGDGCW
jgi:hypothetical protein